MIQSFDIERKRLPSVTQNFLTMLKDASQKGRAPYTNEKVDWSGLDAAHQVVKKAVRQYNENHGDVLFLNHGCGSSHIWITPEGQGGIQARAVIITFD